MDSHQRLLHALRCLELWEAQMGLTVVPAALAALDDGSTRTAGQDVSAGDVVEVVDLSANDAEMIDIEKYVCEFVLVSVIKPDPDLPAPPAVKPDPEVRRPVYACKGLLLFCSRGKCKHVQ